MEIFLFLLMLFLPSFMLEVLYLISSKIHGTLEFVDRPEKKWFIENDIPFCGFLEELNFSFILTFLWYNFEPLRFLCFAYLYSAFQNACIVAAKLRINLSSSLRTLVREFIVPYVIAGPILSLLLDINQLIVFSISTTTFLLIYEIASASWRGVKI